MKKIHYIWVVLVMTVIATGCGGTRVIINGSSLEKSKTDSANYPTISDIMSTQVYLNGEIIMQRYATDVDKDINRKRIKLVNGKEIVEYVVEDGTKVIIQSVDNRGRLTVRVDKAEDATILFVRSEDDPYTYVPSTVTLKDSKTGAIINDHAIAFGMVDGNEVYWNLVKGKTSKIEYNLEKIKKEKKDSDTARGVKVK